MAVVMRFPFSGRLTFEDKQELRAVCEEFSDVVIVSDIRVFPRERLVKLFVVPGSQVALHGSATRHRASEFQSTVERFLRKKSKKTRHF